MKYYFYELMKYISNHKEVQAGLWVFGGILAIIFVPLGVGSLSEWVFSCTVKSGALWVFGAMLSILVGVAGFIVGGLIYVSYLAVLEKLERKD